MKHRKYLVSNSSSTSFIVCFPDRHLTFEDQEVQGAYERFLSSKCAYQDDGEYDILYDVIKPYIIGEVETGPDDGQIILADRDKVKQVLEI